MRNILQFSVLALIVIASAFVSLPAISANSAVNELRSEEVATFNKHVAPIFFKNCAECHRPGEAAPMSLLSYKEARPWAKSIKEKVVSREMPPWHADPRYGEFKNNRRLTDTEIATIASWVDNGAREGEARDLPSAPKFVDGWTIGKPDLVISMPEAFKVDASGPDEYQLFTLDHTFTQDTYVKAVEARPGNRKIVHHLVAMIKPPDDPTKPQLSKEEAEKVKAAQEKESIFFREGFVERVKADAPVYDNGCELKNGGSGRTRNTDKRGSALMSILTVYVPGGNPNAFEEGTVKFIPAGSKIVLQVHYSKAAGEVQTDRSSVALIFATKPPAKVSTTEMVFNTYFQVGPGEAGHPVSACWTTDSDMQITSLMPHMHMRGAAMEVKAVFPDGRKAILLNVPRYDFSWQTSYELSEPLSVPKGTTIFVTGVFDNSAKNRYNPDPTRFVRWGQPTYDEMMLCFIECTGDAKQSLVINR